MSKRLRYASLIALAFCLYAPYVWALGCPDLQAQRQQEALKPIFKSQFEKLEHEVNSLSESSEYSQFDLQQSLQESYAALKKSDGASKDWQSTDAYLTENVLGNWQESYPDGWLPEHWNAIRHNVTNMESLFPAIEGLRPTLADSLWSKTVVQITNTWANHMIGYLEMIKMGVKVDLNRARLVATSKKLLLFRRMAEKHMGQPITDNLSFLD